MFEIAFVACSILNGARCVDKVLTFEDSGQGVMPYACMMPAMHELAKWQEQHPNWTINGWRCGAAGRFARA